MKKFDTFYSIEIPFLLSTKLDRNDVLRWLEHALNTACVELEKMEINPTYKMRELKEI